MNRRAGAARACWGAVLGQYAGRAEQAVVDLADGVLLAGVVVHDVSAAGMAARFAFS
jgi:hypothetical protein